jgi:hypothetical protein
MSVSLVSRFDASNLLTKGSRFKPISAWPSKPTPGWNRQHSRFKAGWQNTLDLLERELKVIDERPSVIF